MDSLEKLKHNRLPPKACFYSSLKRQHIRDEDYKVCRRAWIDENMETMEDFTRWYNNLDVRPFVQAVKRQCIIYRTKWICILKATISLPRLSIYYMFK